MLKHIVKAQHAVAVTFINESQADSPEPFPKRDELSMLLDQGILPIAGFQIVIGDAWAEVVDLMEANVAGEPLQ